MPTKHARRKPGIGIHDFSERGTPVQCMARLRSL
jgi:hypothetical protein